MKYTKIKRGDFAYYVSESVMTHYYNDDESAFCSHGHYRMMEMSDFVVHVPSQRLEKCRYAGEMMIDRLLGIDGNDLIPTLVFDEAH
jgi:hypothetical protein